MSQAQQQQQQAQQPQPGTPEYAQMMAERFTNQGQQNDPNRQSFQQPQQGAQRPEWFPEQLWKADKSLEDNAKALATSYAEARKAISQKGQQPQQQSQQPNAQQEQQAQDAVTAAGLNWDDLGSKVTAKGALDDADYTALEKAGIPRTVVDNVVGAYAAAAKVARERTAEYVGGQEVLNHILTRASQELAPEEVASFNKMLSNDKTAKAALDVLKARFAPTDGEPLGAIFGDGQGTTGLVGFASQFEMIEAMNKRNERGQKLYEVDPAYRAQVRRRVALTK